MRQEQPLADLAIRQTPSSELGDLKLLGGEPIAGIGPAWAECLARGAQFLPRTIAPPGRTQYVEELDRFAQGSPRLDAPPLSAQPCSERKQRSRAWEEIRRTILTERDLK